MQTTAPHVMAQMLCCLDVQPGMTVLEIGTGSGCNAALLSELVGPAGRVVTIEVDPAVSAAARRRLSDSGYQTVECLVGDGLLGSDDQAPYDRIMATCKPPQLPDAWAGQLRLGGLLMLPLDMGGVPASTHLL